MRFISPLIILIVYFVCVSTFGTLVKGIRTGKELPCRLEWKKSPIIPSQDISSFGIVAEDDSKQVIVRIFQNNVAIIGRYDIDGGNLFHPPLTNGSNIVDFEYLINPEGCTTEWATLPTSGAVPKFAVQANEFRDNGQTLVGRHYDKDTKWFPGHVDRQKGQIIVSVTNTDTEEFDYGDFDVLLSFSDGMEMEVVNVIFDEDPYNGPSDFLGMDNIFNNGPGSVTVSVEHKKIIKETYTIEIKETWTTVTTKTITINLLFFKIQRTTVVTVTETKTEKYTVEEETEIKITQEVSVPAYTSVKACSSIKISEPTKVGYTADVKYSAKGRSPDEIITMLKEDRNNITAEIREDGVYATKKLRGEFEAQLAVNTNFKVMSYDSAAECV